MEKAVAPRMADCRAADRMFWVLLTAGLTLFALVTIVPGARQSRALRADVARAKAVTRQLEEANRTLEAREAALAGDPFYNEALLRDKMKYTKPGEKEIEMAPTRDRHFFTETPATATFVPSRMDTAGFGDRVASMSLLAASALLIAAAFVFFDKPAVRMASFRVPG